MLQLLPLKVYIIKQLCRNTLGKICYLLFGMPLNQSWKKTYILVGHILRASIFAEYCCNTPARMPYQPYLILFINFYTYLKAIFSFTNKVGHSIIKLCNFCVESLIFCENTIHIVFVSLSVRQDASGGRVNVPFSNFPFITVLT